MIRIEERATVKVPGITSLFVSFDFDKRIVDEIKLLSNCFYNAETKEWELPLTVFAEFIDRVCNISEIDVKFQAYHEQPIIPQQLQEYKTKPFPYQIDGINYGLNRDSWLLLDMPGLGKTLQLIYLAQELRARHKIDHCLIICGLNALKTNWRDEIHKHSDLDCHILGERINSKGKLVFDGVDARLAELQKPIKEFFVITNIETIRDERIVKAINSGKVNKFDIILFDECHKSKSPTATQSKNLLKLKHAKYKIGATGTLLLNNPLDAYVPLKWIGVENSTYSNFRYYYCSYGGPFNNILVGFKNLSVLQDQIQRYSLRRTKDILDLPPKNIINEYLDMSDEQRKFYDDVKAGVAKEVNKVRLNAANVLAMVGRLRQATACPSILTTANIPSVKLDRAQDIAEQLAAANEKVVIFSSFKETVKVLAERLKALGVVVATGDQSDSEIDTAKYRFMNDKNVKVFLGTWQKVGTGQTLTAASYMIFIDTPWTEGDFAQACDRIHRIGAKNPVFIYNLITRGTIDERVKELITDKGAIAEYVVDQKISPQGVDSLRKYIEEFI